MKLGRLPALRKDKSLVKKNFPRRVYCAADRNKLSQSFLCYKRKKKETQHFERAKLGINQGDPFSIMLPIGPFLSSFSK